LPHEKSSSFSLTNALCFSCSQADERSCGLGGKTRAKSWKNVYPKRRKEDFGEAMRFGLAVVTFGSAIGPAVFAPLLTFLIVVVGWRSAFVLLGGISML
jgi:hypothetical protein